MRCLIKPIFSAFVMLSTHSAWAADSDDASKEAMLDLPEIKVTASRQLLPQNQVSNPVRILDRATLEALPTDDVTEALATLPNVNIRRSGGPDGEPSLGMYGISAQPRSPSSTTLAINGVPLNNGIFPETSLNMLPLALVERIEVIQGPASSAYGNNARLGVINLITRQPKTFGGQVSGAITRWDTNEVGASVGGDIGESGNFLLGYGQRNTDGHLNPKGNADFSDSSLKNFAAFLNKEFGDLKLSTAYIRHSWDRTNPNYLVQPGTPAGLNPRGTPTARDEDGDRDHFNIGAAYQFSPNLYGDLTYNYNSYDEKTTFDADFGTPSGFGVKNPTDQRTRSNGLIAKLNWETDNNLLTVGAERQVARLVDNVANTTTKGNTTGYFIQDRYLAFSNQLALSAGYRIDDFSFYNETSRSPKLGFVFQPQGQNWLVRGNFSRAFSAPSFNQLFGNFGNTKLTATKLNINEVGIEISPIAHLKLGASIFETKTTDPIYPRPRNQNPICTPGPGNCFVNVSGEAKTKGLVLDFRHHFDFNLDVGGSWTYLDPEENTFATSAHVSKLDAVYRKEGWTLSGVLRRETGRYFQDNHLSPFPDFTVIDAAVSYKFNNGLKISTLVENLTDKKYATTQIVSTNAAFAALPIYRPERFITLRAEYNF